MLEASDRGNYYQSLEAIRGIAAVAIVMFHLNDRLDWRFLFDNFYLGVDLFFVLSGFIIFHVYSAAIASRIAYVRFLWLRVARLYPLHLLTLLAFVALEAAVLAGPGPLRTQLEPIFRHNTIWSFDANLLLAHALRLFDGPSFNIPSWSISTEFYTYILFGGLIWAGLIRPDRPFVVPALLVLAAYGVLASVTPRLYVMHDWGFVRNVLGFALGVIAYGVFRRMPSPSTRLLTWMQAGAVIGLLLVLAIPARHAPYGDFVAPVLFAVLIVGCAYDRGGLCPLLTAAPLQWLGRISYSLYLTHYMLVLVAAALFKILTANGTISGAAWQAWALIPVVLAISLALAQLTYQLWELPTRAYLRGLWWGRARPAVSRR
jgi:peptidoglycan/LPS O-acetylase OafA/YrhL